ncbi:histidine kinase [Oculatella sp. LEGE 06141]|uniref:DICT sensory domain-containing protein n=1 Tax=Oculatella sp. LEGE 06141 TaxID=1828648 RepID=UPI0018804FA8|nr:ATP-binding protein [Oculatella sp. LEGE 06141]MBE9178197.1 histidine kinase [Oculatella sp. LEGE 06141]
MNLSCPPDTSLYELAISSEQPPQPLQISPTTFKSMMSVFFDMLIERNISATLWMKLPKGDVWQAEVDRYRRLASAPYSLYTLNTYREDTLEKIDLEKSVEPANRATDLNSLGNFPPEATALIDEQGSGVSSIKELTSLALPLAAESQLRREYFLLVLSEEFCGLVLAHRPRTMRQRKPEAESQDVRSGMKASQATEEDLERRHTLLGLCSLESTTIQHILEGIHRAICYGQSATEPLAEAEELLVNWDSVVTQKLSETLNPAILGHLLTKQIQRQEDLWLGGATHRKQSDTASSLQLENEKLLNAIRLKDEFLNNVGQELRTPLSTMKTALSLLGSPNLKPPQRQRYMEMISQECDRQSSLITSVLDLIQLENVEDQTPAQPLRISDVVPGVVSTYQPLAQEKGIMLAYTIPEDLPAISCFSTWLRQIVINLLHNGIKFTPKGGQVWVRAKQQGDYVQIEFRDTGVGIPTVEIPKIFDRFYRVRQAATDDASGAGLGLSIVQQLLLRCGGSISVKSKPGEGSAFNVMLPIYH